MRTSMALELMLRIFMICISFINHSNCRCFTGNEFAKYSGITGRRSAILKLYHTYMQEHSAHALYKEITENPHHFCKRKFVFAGQAGCGNLGNNQFHYTNGLIHAVVLNRTFFMSNESHLGCNGNLRVNAWMPTYSLIDSFIRELNCSYGNSLKPFISKSLLPTFNNIKELGKNYDYSCYLDRSHVLALSFPGQEWIPHYFYDKSVNSNIFLDETTRHRADILYSHPAPFMSRYEAAGYAFQHIISFSKDVMNSTHDIINSLLDIDKHNNVQNKYHSSHKNNSKDIPQHNKCKFPKNTFTISMHVRHRDMVEGRWNHSKNIAFDTLFLEKLSTLLQKIPSINNERNKCRLLLASDRLETVKWMTSKAMELNCTVYISPKPLEDTGNRTETGILQAEQGPWAKHISQLSDIYLLSHSQYFIGTWTSTYSDVIAFLVAKTMLFVDQSHPTDFIDFVGVRNIQNQIWPACPKDFLQRMKASS